MMSFTLVDDTTNGSFTTTTSIFSTLAERGHLYFEHTPSIFTQKEKIARIRLWVGKPSPDG